MKIFDINNSIHKKILREEIIRIKKILNEGYQYSIDEIWDAMSEDEREQILLAAFDDEGPDLADQYADSTVKWDSIPADVQDRLDLSDYKLAKYDIPGGGSTYLRAIQNFMKQDQDVVKLVNEFVKKTGRIDVRSLTTKQAMDLLFAVHKLINAKKPSVDISKPTSDINPRDFGGGPSQSPWFGRKGYTGD